MADFTKPFFVFLVALLVTYTEAAPPPFHAKHGTHHVRTIGKRGWKLTTYHPKGTYTTYTPEQAPSVHTSSFMKASLEDTAKAFMGTLGVNVSNVIYKSGFADGQTRVAYLRQSINDIPLANAVANVAFNGDKVVLYGSSFVDTSSVSIAASEPTVNWRSVLPEIEDTMNAKYNGHNATLEYLILSDGSIALTHVVQVQNEETNAWYEVFIDAHSGKILSVSDFVADASYSVIPTSKQSFEDGLETLIDPADPIASPLGWHNAGFGNSTTTSGNNVISFNGQQVTVQSSIDLNFSDRYDDNRDPTDAANRNAARVNGFYVINVMHDFAYRYGFTEDNFNFQLNNFDKGGQANDRVLLFTQDASGSNNANFATPPDGQPGICRMFIWDVTSPRRDGAMQNDIIIHEMTHGITNRLTGGGTGRCLQTLESGGLGEGWGDAMASWMNQGAQTRDYVMASYVFGNKAGIRSFPYSTNASMNPLTYQSLQNLNEVHSIGEVWANMLHQVYAALVDAHGFSPNKLTNVDGTEGNIVYMHLFIDALALQPCNPTFVQARDAWLSADVQRYKGANNCIIQKAFASRGLGLRANNGFVNDATVDALCQ